MRCELRKDAAVDDAVGAERWFANGRGKQRLEPYVRQAARDGNPLLAASVQHVSCPD